jgi:Tfp pilus assembly protein PilF
MAFNDALFFARRGARPEARRSIERALERAPNERRLHALRALIDETPGDGPIALDALLPW